MPRDIPQEATLYAEPGHIHPDRVSQVPDTVYGIGDLQLSDSLTSWYAQIIKQTEQFI